MKKRIIIFFLCCWCISAFAQKYKDLLPVDKDGKYGYINEKGELVVPYQYDNASFFREGFAVVSNCLAGKNYYTCDSILVNIINLKLEVVCSFMWGGHYLSLYESRKGYYMLGLFDGYTLIVIEQEDKNRPILAYRSFGTPDVIPAWVLEKHDLRVYNLANSLRNAKGVVGTLRELNFPTDSFKKINFWGGIYNKYFEEEIEPVEYWNMPVPLYLKQKHWDVYYLNDKKFFVRDSENYFIVNSKGKIVSAYWFSNFKGINKKKKGDYGFIVTQNKMKGLMNRYGKVIIPIKYDDVKYEKDEEIIKLVEGEKIGWYFRGKIIASQFDEVRQYHSGLVGCEKDKHVAYFTSKGKQLTAYVYRFYDDLNIHSSCITWTERLTDEDYNNTQKEYLNRRGKIIWSEPKK